MGMATMVPIILKSGETRYQAIIRRDGRVLNTERWKTKTAPREWAKRVEADSDLMGAMDSAGAMVALKELGRDYERWWRKHDRGDASVPAKVK